MNYSNNSYTRGQNTTSDQNSYDLIYKDVVIKCDNNKLKNKEYVVNLNNNYEQIYKIELVAGNVHFFNNELQNVYSIPDSVKNSTFFLSIKELNGLSLDIASNDQENYVNTEYFCQMPDNYTPLGGGSRIEPNPSNCISTFINNSPYNAIQYYNPPISKLNRLSISFFDINGTNLLNPGSIITSPTDLIGRIDTFYLTLRIYYFKKRNNTTAFSVPLFNYAATGTLDSLFQN